MEECINLHLTNIKNHNKDEVCNKITDTPQVDIDIEKWFENKEKAICRELK